MGLAYRGGYSSVLWRQLIGGVHKTRHLLSYELLYYLRSTVAGATTFAYDLDSIDTYKHGTTELMLHASKALNPRALNEMISTFNVLVEIQHTDACSHVNGPRGRNACGSVRAIVVEVREHCTRFT